MTRVQEVRGHDGIYHSHRVPLRHACRGSPLVMPACSSPVIPASFQRESSVVFSCPFLHVALLGKNSGFPIENVGNDRGDVGREGGHDGGEGVPDFIVIAGSAVLPVLFCHACMVSPPSCLPGFPLSPNY